MGSTQTPAAVPRKSQGNIILTGFMGTGKTATGRILAALLGMEFVDTDHVIEDIHGPIPAIFAEQGEDAFRTIERQLARNLASRSGAVISTGGRLMLDPENVEALTANGNVYCLVATAGEIFERTVTNSDGTERPLLAGPNPRQRIIDLLEERAAGYGQFEQVSTSNRSPEEVAKELAALFKSNAG